VRIHRGKARGGAEEVPAFTGDLECARDYLERVVEAGLCDLVWIDQCPVLDRLRPHPEFSALRDTVNARVSGSTGS